MAADHGNRRAVPDQDRQLAGVIAERMLGAEAPNDRWLAIQRILCDLGATSVNAGAICDREQYPLWFRSTLPSETLDAYVASDFALADFIFKHAVSDPNPLRWHTAKRSAFETDSRHRHFADFVRDSGVRSIFSFSRRARPGYGKDIITYCSTLDPAEVMDAHNLRRVETAIRLLLPWLDWPETDAEIDVISIRRAELSTRENQALKLLAGGLMNARIADAMGISEAMVAKHLRSARRKLNAKTREEAVARAVRAAQIDP